MLTSNAIVIRHATHADAETLARLAIVDSQEPMQGPALVAEVDGIARAALYTQDGSVIADPFVPTIELVALLNIHAGQRPARRRRRGLASTMLARG